MKIYLPLFRVILLKNRDFGAVKNVTVVIDEIYQSILSAK